MTAHHIAAWLLAFGVLAGPSADAQPSFGGVAPPAGGSLGANPGQNSGPWPAAGDSSAGNTISPAQTLGYGPATTQAAGGFGAPDAVVGPAAIPANPPAPPPAPARR